MIHIHGRPIGREHQPFIIAEMSGNHNQSLERALEIVEAAARSGAHALKVQTYTADTMTIDESSADFVISDPSSPWAGRSLYDLYQEAHTPWDWHEPIFDRARELGMIPFSSPFDESAVELLEDLAAPCYKIASFENADLPLIQTVGATGKPVIISTGMATVAELDASVRGVRDAGCEELVLLKCTSTYPASANDSNILTIPHLRDLFDCEVGLSDHTLGVGVAVAAVAHGASVVEKHFTLNRADGGVDAAFSMEPAEMEQLVAETERAWQALGQVTYGATESETVSLRFRRSIYVVQDIGAGEELTRENIRVIRPGFGLHPRHFDDVLGRTSTRDLKRGTALQWSLL